MASAQTYLATKNVKQHENNQKASVFSLMYSL